MAKIIYDGKTIVFDKKLYSLSRGKKIVKNSVQAKSGKYTDLTFYEQDVVDCEIRFEMGDVALGKMIDFWNHTSKGNTYDFIVNEDLGFYHPFVNTTSIDGGSISFTRSEDSFFYGSYFDTPFSDEKKLLDFADNLAPNKPRLADGKFYKSYLNEKSTVNYLQNLSYDMSSFETSGTGLVAESNVNDPSNNIDGLTPFLWEIKGSQSSEVTGGINGLNMDNYVGSVYAKSLKNTVALSAGLYFYNGSTLTNVSTESFTIGSEWQRMYATLTHSLTSTRGHLSINYLSATPAPSSVLLAMPQVETFIQFSPSSFAKGEGGPLSRSARGSESCEFDLDNINPRAGTLTFWLNQNGLPIVTPTQNHILAIRKADRTPFLMVYQTVDHYSVIMKDANNNSLTGVYAYPTNLDDWNLFSIRWEYEGAGRGVKFDFRNSTENITDQVNVTGTTLEKDLKLIIGEIMGELSADSLTNFRISDIAIFNKYLDDAVIDNYYNSGKPWGYGKNIFKGQRLNGDIYEPDLRNGVPYYKINLSMESSL